MSGYQIESCEINNSNEIANDWQDLQQRSVYSYFQSWSWIEVWLDLVVSDLHPIVLRVWLDDKLVGIGVFVSRDIKRRKIFRAKAMYLNEYPFAGRNMVTEFNGLLVEKGIEKGHENTVYREAINHLLKKYQQHEEFCFGAILDNSPIAEISSSHKNINCFVQEQSSTWYVDLSNIASGMDGYLASLSRNRRGQIRRSMKLYNQDGTLQLNVASNEEEALSYFDRLNNLHSAYWKEKGQSGSFSNPLWVRFHKALIRNRFSHSEVQLIQVKNASGEIGYLYNLIQQGHVYVIQTGFASEQDKRLMPGYVAHTLAIVHNQNSGMKAYDLMHGDVQYKRILCNATKKLEWLVVQRKRLKFTIENSMVSIKRKVSHIVSKVL